uniref:Thiamin biosynthesis protein S n=1 Tax=Chondria sp. (in: red algae) TaxID=1982705 RepID=A0A1Z1ME54_9FLOR|nr:thiamin biosynthesis protein S [Chondria sp. (in: red algae)]
MQDYLTIFINGEPFHCDPKMSFISVLSYLNFDIDNVVIEYNRQILDRHKLKSLCLVNNDSFEIITIVGGG